MHLLDSDRLGQVSWEVNIESLSNCQPIRHQLERNNIEQTLQAVDGLWNLDLLAMIGFEFLVIGIANNNRLA